MTTPVGGVGILAGGGPLPGMVARSVAAAGRPVFILGFAGFAEPAVIEPWPHEYVRLGAAGQMLSLLRQHGCTDLVLIGPIRRPSLRSLRPDAEGARILARLGRALFAGDDGLLAALVRILGEEGFHVRGAHEFLAQAVVEQPGVLGRVEPDEQALRDIRQGVRVVQALGGLDIGQGCVVQNGVVLAVEAMEGTDRMLARAGECRQPGEGGARAPPDPAQRPQGAARWQVVQCRVRPSGRTVGAPPALRLTAVEAPPVACAAPMPAPQPLHSATAGVSVPVVRWS